MTCQFQRPSFLCELNLMQQLSMSFYCLVLGRRTERKQKKMKSAVKLVNFVVAFFFFLLESFREREKNEEPL